MTPGKAFDATLEHFGVKASHIAKKTGLAESQVSKFRHESTGVNFLDTHKMVSCLPKEAQRYYYNLLLVDDHHLQLT